MTMDQKQIDEALRRAKEAKESAEKIPEGCADHSCLIRRPSGMATNGGCRYSDFYMRRAVKSYRRQAEAAPDLASDVEALAKALQEAREEIERLKREKAPPPLEEKTR